MRRFPHPWWGYLRAMDLKRLLGATALTGALLVGGAACTDDGDGGATEVEPPGGSGDDTIPIGDPEATETDGGATEDG